MYFSTCSFRLHLHLPSYKALAGQASHANSEKRKRKIRIVIFQGKSGSDHDFLCMPQRLTPTSPSCEPQSAYFLIAACLLRSTAKTGDLSQPGDAGCCLVNVLAYRLDAGSEAAGEASAIAEYGKEAFSQLQRCAPGFTID